jgi:hypothetical protein
MSSKDFAMIDHLKTAMGKTVEEFQHNPEDFLYEENIRSLMYANLRCKLNQRNEYKDARAIQYVKKPVNVSLVQAEYPRYSKLDPPVKRFDLAILAVPDSDSDRWHQPCRVAIEIKLWQPGENNEGPWRDINKLRRYWEASKNAGRTFTGIAMLFILPGAESRVEKEKRIKKITGIQPCDFPLDGVALHLVTPKGALHLVAPEGWYRGEY